MDVDNTGDNVNRMDTKSQIPMVIKISQILRILNKEIAHTLEIRNHINKKFK